MNQLKPYSVQRLAPNIFTQKKKEETSLKEKDVLMVRQGFTITMARHKYDIYEQRIMIRIIQALQDEMKYDEDRYKISETILGDKILHLPTKSLLPEGNKHYEKVKTALVGLENKKIIINGTDKYGKYESIVRLILKSKYYLSNQIIEIKIDKDVLRILLRLNKNYTKYMFNIAFNCSSSYTMRLYQFISHWRDKKYKKVTIEEVRGFLQLGRKYPNPYDFKKNILIPASIELKEKGDVWFEIHKQIKVGRSVMGYVLKITSKGKLIEEVKSAELHTDNIESLLKSHFGFQSNHLDKIRHIISDPKLHKKVYKKIASDELDYYIRKNSVKSIPAYVVASIKAAFD